MMYRYRLRRLASFVASPLVLLLFAAVAGAQGDPAQLAFFETKIRPLLAQNCYGCHSSKAPIQHAGLKLDSRQAILDGGDSGPAVDLDQPERSRLLQALGYEGAVKMPPQGKLDDAALAAVAEWIAMGAPWPEEAAPVADAASQQQQAEEQRKRLEHWAWKNPVKADPPSTRDQQWPSGEIDRFLLAALEAKGLAPSPDADRRTLLRRIYFDLTGLPPSPEQIEAFVADTAPDAYERIVDELLASPRFGERWGRHWLDVTYYADNLEIGRRIPAPEAWRYRDYVIQSFNEDKPYDRFVREQIAGDLLPAANDAERREQVVATGMLALGPWPLVNADKEQLRMDVVDFQLDLIGKTFLGLTVGCARCHDHKFDPISARDYYAMGGILASTETLNGRIDGIFSDVNRTPLPETPEELRRRAEALEVYTAERTRLVEEKKALEKKIEAAKAEAEGEPAEDAPEEEAEEDPDAKRLKEVSEALTLLEFNRPVPPYAFAVRDIDAPADIKINLRGNAHLLGEVAPRSFIETLMWDEAPVLSYRASGRLELADWIAAEKNPMTAKVFVNRVWQHLFGVGLVPSVDNFGLRGDKPSHPELLDFLAARFVEQGWSIKKTVRSIVLSRAYRQSSAYNEAAATKDPENRLLWRANRRRLEGEAIRDAVLSITGELDLTAGGPSLPLDIPGNVSLGAPAEFKDSATLPDEQLARRTVYQPVLRKGQLPGLDVLNLFDFPDVSQITGARTVTTVPTQALYLMNAPFLLEQSERLAERAAEAALAGDARVDWLLPRVFGRPAGPDDRAAATGFVDELAAALEADGAEPADAARRAWARYCHALLVSNEFLYVQ